MVRMLVQGKNPEKNQAAPQETSISGGERSRARVDAVRTRGGDPPPPGRGAGVICGGTGGTWRKSKFAADGAVRGEQVSERTTRSARLPDESR